MIKSQLIKDITVNKISLEEGLQMLLIISSELNNKKLTNWIMREFNGYSEDLELPKYRKKIGSNLICSGINGTFKVTNVTLPIHYLPKEYREIVSHPNVKTSIRGIEKMLDTGGIIGMDLTELAGDVYNKAGIQCYKIFQEYNKVSIEDIISNVKNRLIVILIDLEKEFGLLDNLDIDTDFISQQT